MPIGNALSRAIRSQALQLAILLTAGLTLLTVVFRTADVRNPTTVDEITRLASCRATVFGVIKPDRTELGLLEQISNLCYTQVRGESLLADFNIRRTNFLQQQSQGNVIMWMVVAITLSGVVLAGIQLLAAYRLASAGQGDFNQPGEITLQQNKISLKSSVTGLMILTVSFAFFLVYIIWVYTIHDVQSAPESDARRTSTPVVLQGFGGLSPGATPAQPKTESPPPAAPSPSP